MIRPVPPFLCSNSALSEMEFKILLRLRSDGVFASLASSREAIERAIFESSAKPVDDVRRLTRCQQVFDSRFDSSQRRIRYRA